MGMHRSHVNKRKSARSFRKNISRTKAANMAIQPTRGGWRL
nr:MAG: DNA binding protein [Microviridae sp.]